MSEDVKDIDTAEKTAAEARPLNFIEEIIEEDLRTGKNVGRVATRFPPEPNGYLHIGHAKAICVDFGNAQKYGGTCNLRFDDTNPTKEDIEYVDAIKEDIAWLGFSWAGMYYASDYFEKIYQYAEDLIRKGLAYVDESTEEELREFKGDFYRKGRPTKYRDRPMEESLDLFRRMRAGEFADSAMVLRAKIDLESQNMNMRDPALYRIRRAHHHRTGDQWCIYPMYDYAHPLSDAEEKITYSLCTLEFEAHRPLYDWFIQAVGAYPSRQIEFARLNLTYTVMSKRKLLELVQKGLVDGWDDPRMPTICGLRRRGYTPESIRAFADRIGVAKKDSMVDLALLEHTVREDLNPRVPRYMAVIDPLKVVIENMPAGETIEFDAPLSPEDPSLGTRKIALTREIFIEREDFMEVPSKKWFRMSPGAEVRLRYACLLKCESAVKDADGRVVELRCTWDPESKGGVSPDGRKVKGTLHWVPAAQAVDAEVRLYDKLFTIENLGDMEEGASYIDYLNPESLVVVKGAKLEPAMAALKAGDRVQFERVGYFCVDTKDTKPGALVFNRTVGLKDSWQKVAAKEGEGAEGAGSGTGTGTGSGTGPSPARTDHRETGANAPGTEVVAPAPVVPAVSIADLPVPEANPNMKPICGEIIIDDFAKVDLRVAVVRHAERVPEADKLLRLLVDLGEGRLRQIFAGIKKAYEDPAALVGKKIIIVANLKPRQMKFGISEGMLLAAGEVPDLGLATFDRDVKPGDRIG